MDWMISCGIRGGYVFVGYEICRTCFEVFCAYLSGQIPNGRAVRGRGVWLLWSYVRFVRGWPCFAGQPLPETARPFCKSFRAGGVSSANVRPAFHGRLLFDQRLQFVFLTLFELSVQGFTLIVE